MKITTYGTTEQIGAFGMSASAHLVAPVSTTVQGCTLSGAGVGFPVRPRTGLDKTVLIPSADVADPPCGRPPV